MSDPVQNHSRPTVSVLVRSLDRPQLQEALDSVAAQTWPHIEVVVVAVHPGHRPLPDRIGAHPLRLLEADAARPRSQAANVGLKAACGDWLLFLDDDDWLMPDHIERLLKALMPHPETLAAYTGVALVDGEGQPLGQVIDLPWDATRLLCGNLAPIHAVLFSAALREQGCRFDETLDRYEDWDFWLQIARRSLMLHLPGVSAVYRIHQSSGVHEDSAAATERVQEKWLLRLNRTECAGLMRRAWAYDDALLRLEASERHHQNRFQQQFAQAERLLREQAELSQQLQHQAAELARAAAVAQHLKDQLNAQRQSSELELAQLREQLSEQSHRADRLAGDLTAIQRSSSWRLTAPLRWLRATLRR